MKTKLLNRSKKGGMSSETAKEEKRLISKSKGHEKKKSENHSFC